MSDSSGALFARAQALLAERRVQEAEAIYRHVVEVEPQHAEAHFYLGTTLFQRGALEDAEAAFRRSLELRPTLVEAFNNLGVIAQRRRRPELAVEYYRRALALRPNQPASTYFTSSGQGRYLLSARPS